MRLRLADLLFGLAALAGVSMLIWTGRELTFFFDEWQVILEPNPLSPSTLLAGHNDQIFVVPRLVYGVGLEVFGMTSQLPFRLVTAFAATVCSTLLYIFVRRRTSSWFALVLVLPVLVLGASWEGLLLGLSLNFQIGMAAGVGMLLALESRRPWGDPLAGLLLLCSLACGGIGLAFAAGALVDVVLRGIWRRAWIVALPLLAVGVWYLSLGAGGESSIEYVSNALNLPLYFAHASWAGVRAGLGLSGGGLLDLAGRYLAPAAVLVLGVASICRLGFTEVRVSSRVYVAGAILAAFWLLGGLAFSEGRAPEASRYQYPAVVLLFAYGASLLDGLPLPRWLPLAMLPLALLSVVSNVSQLNGGREFLLEQTQITRAAIGQIEIEGDGPGYHLTEEVTGSPYQRLIESNRYLRARERFGSPAFGPDEIEKADWRSREAAAGVAMAAALARARENGG